jgi:hypothetical protein
MTFSAISLSHLLSLYDKVNTYSTSENSNKKATENPLQYIISTETTILSPKLSYKVNIDETVPDTMNDQNDTKDDPMPLDECLEVFRNGMKRAILQQYDITNQSYQVKIAKEAFVDMLIYQKPPKDEYVNSLLKAFFTNFQLMHLRHVRSKCLEIL